MKREIPEWGGYYIDTDGKVYGKRGEEMQPYIRPNGYLSISLRRKEGDELKKTEYLVHRLVALTFLGKPPKNKKNVNHKNGIKDDNRLSNLEYISNQGNVQHAVDSGLLTTVSSKKRIIGTKDDGEEMEFDSLRAAEKHTGYELWRISKVLRGVTTKTGEWTWRYAEEAEETPDHSTWSVIPGFPGYKVSRSGQIVSIRRNQLIKQHLTGNYYCICIYQDAKSKIVSVHRLVALTYVDNPDNLPVVDHIDGDHQNNNVENLRWVTHQQNSQFAVDLGLTPKPVGYKVEQLDDDGEVIATYFTLKEATEATGANPNTISLCCKGTRKKSGGYAWRFASDEVEEAPDDDETPSDD